MLEITADDADKTDNLTYCQFFYGTLCILLSKLCLLVILNNFRLKKTYCLSKLSRF